MVGGCGLQCSLSGPADNSVSYIMHLKIFLCLNQIRVYVVPATKETVTYTHIHTHEDFAGNCLRTVI